MLHVSQQRCSELEGRLPAPTLSYLVDTGIPEQVRFRGLDFAFSLGFEPLLNGRAYRVGDVDRGFYAAAIELYTGHFGLIIESEKKWGLVNSSIAQFIACAAATEHLWEMEAAKKVRREERAKILEREIGRIDPIVFDDSENPWSFLIEELRDGIV
jgi:hypothetical protein